jgi:hypothetical protein
VRSSRVRESSFHCVLRNDRGIVDEFSTHILRAGETINNVMPPEGARLTLSGGSSVTIGTMPTLKGLDHAEEKMNKARLALLNEIDRPRDNQKYRQMVSELSECIEQYMSLVHQLSKP